MNKKEKAACARWTREDIEGEVRELCLATVRLDEAEAQMNIDLAKVRERYEPDMAALKAVIKETTEGIQAWADAHPGEFATRKSIIMVHGTLGYRKGTPSLKTVRGVTWDKVLALLREHLPQYVRTKEEVDKEALLADRDGLGETDLEVFGLRVEQAERFFVEPNKEKVRAAS